MNFNNFHLMIFDGLLVFGGLCYILMNLIERRIELIILGAIFCLINIVEISILYYCKEGIVIMSILFFIKLVLAAIMKQDLD